MPSQLSRSFAIIALLLGAACGSQATPPPAALAAGKQVDQATAGAITGRVVFEGTPPPIETIRMGTDQACVQGAGPNPQSDAVLIAGDGALQNVFVYVKDGLDPAYTFTPPTTSVLLDQKACRYAPRVLGVMVGQPLEIVNSDSTLHNVHALPRQNQEFNKGQPVQGSRMTQTFTVPEVMVRFKCDVHGWMTAWVGVLPHPFFAVTGPDGSFELKGLPPGTYTVEAWHEKFGTRTATVTVGDRQTATTSFTFSNPAGSRP
jgi:plastocyanin